MVPILLKGGACLLIAFLWSAPVFGQGEQSAETPPAAAPTDPQDPLEFVPDRNQSSPFPELPAQGKKKRAEVDQNIDFDPMLRRLEYQENPKGYRHPYLGAEGWRPNTIAFSYGGRTPGYGGFFDYSFNRIGVGISASYRPEPRFYVDPRVGDPLGYGQIFANVWAHYNLIPYHVSPYILVGVEYANGAERPVESMAGGGVEARFYYGLTLFVEVIRHETVRKTFAGAALGYAF